MDKKFVIIKRYVQLIEASLDKTKLDSEGIESILLNKNFASTHSLLSDATGGIKLQVKKSDAEQAIKILKELDNIKYCLRCNEIMNNSKKCDSCGYTPEVKTNKWSKKTLFFLMLLSILPFWGITMGVAGIFQKDRRINGLILLLIGLSSGYFIYFNYYISQKNIIYYKNGSKRQERYIKNGKLEGKVISYYRNGNKQEESIYKNGKLDGKVILFYKNGNKHEETFRRGDKLYGKYIQYYKTGEKSQEGFYKNGKLDGKFTFYYKSVDNVEIFYKNGKLE